jgi:tagatose 1,6-diphosphate aldolase
VSVCEGDRGKATLPNPINPRFCPDQPNLGNYLRIGHLARHLATGASGVLIDAYYGAWSCIASAAIGPQSGLLVRVEKSGGPKNNLGAPLGLIEPGWSVEKIKLMGADAVKLLAQYEPSESNSAEHQFQLIDHVYAECRKHDILMLLETVAFPFGGEKKTDASFLNRKAATVIDSAR